MSTYDRELEELRQQLATLTARVHRLETAGGLGTAVLESPAAATVSETMQVPAAGAQAPEIGLAEGRGLPPAEAVPARPERAAHSLESQIGSQWLNRVGIVTVLIGVSFFLRYAFENNWVGPAGRVSLGLLAGIGVILWSERFRSRGYLAFSWSLKAAGVGTLYLSLWAAFQLYALVPPGLAFAAMAAVTASTAVLALRQDAMILAVFAMVGGYATPVLLSTGANRPVELFTYLAVLNLGVLTMVRWRPWASLVIGAFVGTTALFIGWYAAHFTAADGGVGAGFATLFFGMFAAAPLLASAQLRPDDGVAAWTRAGRAFLLVLPLFNAVVYFFQLVATLELRDENAHTLVALVMAAAYLGLAAIVKQRIADPAAAPLLSMLHAGVALAFITIAIPLKLGARWIALGWLTEAAVLLWIGLRRDSTFVTRFGIAALALALLRLLAVDDYRTQWLVLNERFLTFSAAIALLGAVAWFGYRTGRLAAQSLWIVTVTMNLLALMMLSREVGAYFLPGWQQSLYAGLPYNYAPREFAYSAVWMGHGALVMLAGFLLRSAMLRWQALVIIGITIAKVFLSDLQDLDQGYRILSFIGLGLLLLAISFAYQRDLLKLRQEPPASGQAQPQ